MIAQTAQVWAEPGSELPRRLEELTRKCLNAYRENPLLVQEHANIERARKQGGYGRRQVFELVQNGADALQGRRGRVEVRLTPGALYCANEGTPVQEAGIEALLGSHLSRKRGQEIGRYGLGFKSVLGVTDRPEVFSHTASFRFDPSDSGRRIREIVPDAETVPILRLATAIDPHKVFAVDPVLDEMRRWATTIVRLPFAGVEPAWLFRDLEEFPEEFLLFCAHVEQLKLGIDVGGSTSERTIRVERDGRLFTVRDGKEAKRFKVFQALHVPSKAAGEEGGELADRSNVPLIWAVPMARKASEGEFWAFFETNFRTTLSGILNAPWNLNDDRQNLLEDVFNRELLEHAAQMVAGAIPELVDPSDPGRYLEMLPARGKETRNWADAFITDAVYKKAINLPSLPDMNGELRTPMEVRLQPDKLPEGALAAWGSLPNPPSGWVHPSAATDVNRRSRAVRLLLLARRSVATISEWLESMVEIPSIEGSRAAILAAAEIVGAEHTENVMKDAIRKARVVLTSSGTYVKPIPGALFLPGEEGNSVQNVTTVDAELAALPGVREALELLGITEVDASSELEALLRASSAKRLERLDWSRAWKLVRKVEPVRATELLLAAAGSKPWLVVKAKTVSGKYRPLIEVLLPGPVVSADGGRADADVTICPEFHEGQEQVLRELGAVDQPCLKGLDVEEAWFSDYHKHGLGRYREEMRVEIGHKKEQSFVFDRDEGIGPLAPLLRLSNQGKARYTERLLLLSSDETDWVLRYRSVAPSPELPIEPPCIWAIREYGMLATSLGLRPVDEAVTGELAIHSRILPVAECVPSVAARVGLPARPDELDQEDLKAAFKRALSAQPEDSWRLYGDVCQHHAAPPKVLCRIGDGTSQRVPRNVVAAHAGAPLGALVDSGEPFLVADTDERARALCRQWGMRPLESVVQTELRFAASGSEESLEDRYYGLVWGHEEQTAGITLVPCSTLRIETVTRGGRQGQELEFAREGSRIYHSDALEPRALLLGVADQLGLGLSDDLIDSILDQQRSEGQQKRCEAVRSLPTLAERLAACVGEPALRRGLPSNLLATAEGRYGKLDAIQVAELALAVFGTEALLEFRSELRTNGFDPPGQWAGKRPARQFVRSLGFPTEYAGFESPDRDNELLVDGPIALPELHGYQKTIVGKIRRLVTAEIAGKALLSLPTGAGKTRVAVQALVESIREGELEGPVLWVAQTDELCEQAMQTWSEVWRSQGGTRRLVLNRLWGSNDVEYRDGRPQVVIATDRKLQHVVDRSEYDWLRSAACLVIDEAHLATAPIYTKILEWQGHRRGKGSRPLLGLTATAFRSSEAETKQLAGRFGRKRLDHGVFSGEPYPYLQSIGVLAKVDHRVLDGASIALTPSELSDLRERKRLSASAEQRLGADSGRTERLLNSILAEDQSWPILVFATSVDHARTLAALLAAEGVSARAVSADTSDGARRSAIESFRRGDVRVLTNYGVLTTGFDAPAVRAIYVARPTFSPVLYQQMIGRGLRGPKNRGKERCLIVNVKDNFQQYGEELAFTGFEALWKR